jgi:hypothetical protein
VDEASTSWLLGVQRSAGNAAVVSMLGQTSAEPAMVARAPLPGLLRAELGTIQRRGGKRGRRAKAAKATATSAPTETESAETETEDAETETTTESGETETGETETAETESAETTTTTSTATTGSSTGSGTPAPAPQPQPDPKIAALKAVIGERPYANMLAQLGNDAAVVKYGEDCGAERLKELIYTYRLTAAVLQHYGAAMLKTFVGCGDTAWAHLTTARLNSQGAISGGHDSGVFMSFLSSVDYELDGTRGTGEVYKVWYKDDEGRAKGSKTLIRGLAGKKKTWQGYFNDALWQAIRDKKLVAGTCYISHDGWDYGLYWRSGAAEVDTIYPA